ncbi:xanthine dehydrogenase family protein molybdopterin-binding subunit [Chloroflexota bacterium]
MSNQLSVVGKRIPRQNAEDKVTGAARYTVDIKLPGILEGMVLRSPYPHARILSVDKSKAEKLPGVVAVITSEDVPEKLFNISDLLPLASDPEASGIKRDQRIFTDKARFVGDAVAAVAAINKRIAEEALGLIEVEYERLSAVFDPVEAMNPDAPEVHDSIKGNIAWYQPFTTPVGDVEKGFSEADYIVEETFSTSKQMHYQLEPAACVANFDATGRLIIWSPCQAAFILRNIIADLFDIPEGKVRVITPHVGGGFGNGTSLRAEPICVALAKKTGKPVRLEFTREEHSTATETRQPNIQTAKMGVKKDGTITAIQTKLISDAGAYITQTIGPTNASVRRVLQLYKCLNLAGEANIIYTNTPVSGAFRGYGTPESMWVLEQLVDIAAEKIGMDAVEFRLKNHIVAGDSSSNPTILVESCALDECIKLGAEKIGWKEKRGGEKIGVRRRGVGMAIMMHVSCTYPIRLEHTSAFIKLNEDGSANLLVSACDMGQDILGALAQISAEELGISAEDIHVVSGNTDVTMFDAGQRASRSCYVMGNAVLRAAGEAKQQLLVRAAKMLKVSADELEVKNRRIYVKEKPDIGISVAEVSKAAIYNFNGDCLNISGKCSWEAKGNPLPFQAVFAEVEVDTETGEVTVIKVVIAHDIGRAINPMTVEGQLEGGIMQGIGYALTENCVINRDSGVLESDNYTTYRIASSLDVPETEVLIVEQPTPSGPFGAKSVGESGLNAIAPAIANAVYNAVGVRIKDLPITPEKILDKLITMQG